MVSRLYKAHPSQGNRYYLQLLLLHQTHVIDWKSLKRVDGVFYDTYREACDALGLLKDDEEWKHCLEDAARSQSANLVYNLFFNAESQLLRVVLLQLLCSFLAFQISFLVALFDKFLLIHLERTKSV